MIIKKHTSKKNNANRKKMIYLKSIITDSTKAVLQCPMYWISSPRRKTCDLTRNPRTIRARVVGLYLLFWSTPCWAERAGDRAFKAELTEKSRSDSRIVWSLTEIVGLQYLALCSRGCEFFISDWWRFRNVSAQLIKVSHCYDAVVSMTVVSQYQWQIQL